VGGYVHGVAFVRVYFLIRMMIHDNFFTFLSDWSFVGGVKEFLLSVFGGWSFSFDKKDKWNAWEQSHLLQQGISAQYVQWKSLIDKQ